MPAIWFDHFLTYARTANVDEHVNSYAALGFQPDEKTVRHEPGLRNRFIFLGPEYIEFCWVEEEALFVQADEQDKTQRRASRPFGIGLLAADIHALHDDWIRRGFTLPEVWSKAPRDAPPGTPPLWSFQDIPAALLPGTSCFALTYHSRPKDQPRRILQHPNTIYAIAGVSFVAHSSQERAACWRDLLAPTEALTPSRAGWEVHIGPHRVNWMSPEGYRSTFGWEWTSPAHPNAELAALHLLCTDLEQAKGMFRRGGREVSPLPGEGDEIWLVKPDDDDGFVFTLRQQPREAWLQERIARTGENLTFA